jgi:surfactin synthase thioesterase subunit
LSCGLEAQTWRPEIVYARNDVAMTVASPSLRTSGQWLVCLRRLQRPRLRLICFPSGGSGPSSFWPWIPHLHSAVELWAVCLPGRERRNSEDFVTEGHVAVEAIAAELRELRGIDSAFYGHSLGAGLAYQIAESLGVEPQAKPKLLILSGRMPPHHPCRAWADKSDGELIAELVQLGGISAELLREKAFAAIYLPRIRADCKINESLRYGSAGSVDIPIAIINGADDALVAADSLCEWRRYTTMDFEAHTVSGGHFFIQSHLDQAMTIIAGQLRRLHDDLA